MKRATQMLFTLLFPVNLLQRFLIRLPNMLFQLLAETQSSVKQFPHFSFILCWPKEQAFWHVELLALPEFSLTMKNLWRKSKWRMQSARIEAVCFFPPLLCSPMLNVISTITQDPTVLM